MTATPSSAPLLVLSNASVVQNNTPILNNITLCIPDGEHCAILGPNGSGKSSLLKLITRQWYPLATADNPTPIELFGRTRWNVFALRTLLGIVSSDLHAQLIVGPHRLGLDIVLSGFFASHGVAAHATITPAMREAATRALGQIDALPLADKPFGFMSTGEVRRILVARALAHSPRALLLDEPTAGLDLVAAHRLLRSVQSLAQAGTTVLLVTHHVEEILPEIGRVVLLKQGHVAFDGPKADALSSPCLSALYETPITVSAAGGYFHATAALADP